MGGSARGESAGGNCPGVKCPVTAYIYIYKQCIFIYIHKQYIFVPRKLLIYLIYVVIYLDRKEVTFTVRGRKKRGGGEIWGEDSISRHNEDISP